MTDSQPTDPVKVVYVVGSGRSGTTLMDTILSNHPSIYGAGEMATLNPETFTRMYCPCGSTADQCPFWSSVLKEWCQRTGMRDLTEHDQLRKSFEGPRLHRLWRLLCEGRQKSAAFERYAFQTTSLYRTIRDISGRDMVVDSSAIPMRAYALSLMPEIDLRLIHLVRDGRGVAWSLKKAFQVDQKAGVASAHASRPVWRSAVTWIGYNIAAGWVCRRVPKGRAHFCRYEDLSANSEVALKQLGDFLNCDFTDLIQRITTSQGLKVGCTFGGNRMRMSGEVKVRMDTDWTKNLSPDEERTMSRLCGWLMRKYGYETGRRAA